MVAREVHVGLAPEDDETRTFDGAGVLVGLEGLVRVCLYPFF
jgi:hypothetical protein